jgi:hypothetical protein
MGTTRQYFKNLGKILQPKRRQVNPDWDKFCVIEDFSLPGWKDVALETHAPVQRVKRDLEERFQFIADVMNQIMEAPDGEGRRFRSFVRPYKACLKHTPYIQVMIGHFTDQEHSDYCASQSGKYDGCMNAIKGMRSHVSVPLIDMNGRFNPYGDGPNADRLIFMGKFHVLLENREADEMKSKLNPSPVGFDLRDGYAYATRDFGVVLRQLYYDFRLDKVAGLESWSHFADNVHYAFESAQNAAKGQPVLHPVKPARKSPKA